MIFIESFKNLFIKLALIITFIIIIIYNFFISKNSYSEINSLESIVENSTENKIELDENNKIKVYIAGEVNTPGVFELDEDSRVEDAIASAGGLTNLANIKNINLALIIEDGEKIYIPNINDNDIIDYSAQESPKSSKVNINKADVSELQNLPGVGVSLAEKIFNYRKENGNFKKIEDLKNVNGIGEKKFEALKEYILNGRPDSSSEFIFLRAMHPYLPFNKTVALTHLWSGYQKKAGIERYAHDGKGFHALRRTLGKELTLAEVPVTTTAQILGHRSMDSSKQYISLDSYHLKECALDFSGIEVTLEGYGHES